MGVPPDLFNTQGQNWGLPPLIPHKLREAGYQPFIEIVRSALRHAGGLRIDHVLGLFRSFWIPDGFSTRMELTSAIRSTICSTSFRWRVCGPKRS